MNSALSFAARAGHTEAVRELLGAGASVCSSNEVRLSTEDYSVLWIFEFTYDYHACKQDRRAPLHLAAKGGHEAIAKLLLDSGADINAVDKVIVHELTNTVITISAMCVNKNTGGFLASILRFVQQTLWHDGVAVKKGSWSRLPQHCTPPFAILFGRHNALPNLVLSL